MGERTPATAALSKDIKARTTVDLATIETKVSALIDAAKALDNESGLEEAEAVYKLFKDFHFIIEAQVLNEVVVVST